MTTLEAIFLGCVQGLTEFLPISSSGHLSLMQRLLGLENPRDYILFDLVCHLGTLLSICIYYFHRLIALFQGDKRTFLKLLLGTLPLFAVAAIFPYIKSIYANPTWMGLSFMMTAFLLYISSGERGPPTERERWSDPFVVGCSQAFAVLPGLSRSGTTIAVARLLRWPRSEAVSFSFMLAIPAILGGVALESLRLITKGEVLIQEIGVASYIAGFSTSFLVGSFAIALATRLVLQDALVYFAWYCLAVGLFCLIYFDG